MRPIKFRVWDIPMGEMLYPKWEEDYVGGGDRKIGLIIYRTNDGRGHSSLSWCLTHPEDFILMQYTGLKDKNGVESFAGDLFQVDGKYWYRMVWFDRMACFGLWPEDARMPPIYGTDLENTVKTNEIAGNIHANPDLIGE